MPVNRTSKMLAYVYYRMRVTILDGRQIVGRFMAFDRHMNLVPSDAEEFASSPEEGSERGGPPDPARARLPPPARGGGGEPHRGGPPPNVEAQAQRAPRGRRGRPAGRGMPGAHPRPDCRDLSSASADPRRRACARSSRGAHGEAPPGSAPDAPARVQAGMPPQGMPPPGSGRDAPAGHAPAGVQAGPPGPPPS